MGCLLQLTDENPVRLKEVPHGRAGSDDPFVHTFHIQRQQIGADATDRLFRDNHLFKLRLPVMAFDGQAGE